MSDSKNRLLRAGLELFAEKGYKSASVRTICDRAEVTINMISHHFGGKKGLLQAVINRFGQDVYIAPLRIIREEAKNKEDFTIRLRLFTYETMHAMLNNKALLKILYNPGELTEIIDAKEVFAQVIEYQSKYLDFLKSGVKVRAVRSDIDLSMLTGLLWDRMVFQVLYQKTMVDIFQGPDISEQEYRQEWLDANLELFLKGLLT
ncbi:MAG: helix-turn-helix domain-containing protein [Leptospirales bacterium]